MLVLIVLLISWLVFRGAGAAGAFALDSWHDSARYAMVVMFVFTSTAHFGRMKHDLAQMIPPLFSKSGKPPKPLWLRTPMPILLIAFLWRSTRS